MIAEVFPRLVQFTALHGARSELGQCVSESSEVVCSHLSDRRGEAERGVSRVIIQLISSLIKDWWRQFADATENGRVALISSPVAIDEFVEVVQ